MNHSLKSYSNFKQLRLDDELSARLLNDKLGIVDFGNLVEVSRCDKYRWGDTGLLVFDNVSNYAAWEITDGWYASNGINVEIDADPNLVDYIDLESFGEDLLRRGDTSIAVELPNGKVAFCEDGL